MNRLDTEVTVLALDKSGERYLFIYSDDHVSDCLMVFGRFASNPELSFTWMDAAKCARQVREGVGA